MGLPNIYQPFVVGTVATPVGRVPRVSSSLTRADRWGSVKARWGVGRMRYCVDPGLYALGKPDAQSKVLVTANYKMSFDRLRGALPGLNAWILVLDTNGINVWCAAGKGTFGTEELIRRIEGSGLSQVVAHREIVLPQLAGPGVAAYQVRKRSGFQPIFGPVRAEDLPPFLQRGMKATPGMRRKTFPFRERLVLIPVELVNALKPTMIILPIFFIVGGLGGPAAFWMNALHYGLFAVLAIFSALISGAVLTPLLLPFLPARSFSVKGLYMGLLTVVILGFWRWGALETWGAKLDLLSWVLMVPAISAYLAMNFTGASTYTSLSGVRKEMGWAVPMEIGVGALGLFLWLGSRFVS